MGLRNLHQKDQSSPAHLTLWAAIAVAGLIVIGYAIAQPGIKKTYLATASEREILAISIALIIAFILTCLVMARKRRREIKQAARLLARPVQTGRAPGGIWP